MGSSTDKADVQAAAKTSPSKTASKMHRRSRSGCFTCRLRRKKCDEGKPKCKACRHLGLDCEYKRPLWWSNNDTRRQHKEDIKGIIKNTKTNEKSTSNFQSHYRRISPPVLSHSVPTSDTYSDAPGTGARHLTRASTPDSDQDGYDAQYEQAFATTPGFYDPYAMPLYAQHMSHPPLYNGIPYEIDVKTERQMFVNDVPTRRDSTISTFSTFVPPPPTSMLPSYTGTEDYSHQDYFPHPLKQESVDEFGEESLDFNFFDFSHPSHPQPTSQPFQTQATATIPIEDSDRGLFDYMLNAVLPLLFPILEANQHNSVRNDIILPSLENNKAYLHSCLNAAAVHQKSHLPPTALPSELTTLDNDILHHKFAFVTHVVDALNSDKSHLSILEATLGMIAMHTVVGSASNLHSHPSTQEIPWHSHFQAATELVSKLALPSMLETMPQTGAHPPFNMTLTAWIDILGSTMLGRSPTFANTYRNKHLSGSTSGLAELMGCHDGVMYLLSEVACLDSLKVEHKLDDVAICSHITSLAQQLDATEPTGEVLTQPYSKSGALRPKQLSRNLTAIFRKATRVYLCSLVPNFNRYEPAICNLVAQMADLLQFIPSGPEGFDRSLVWPYLICGANCTPSSPLRRVLAERIEALGPEADHGAFGRMVRLLHEVWRRNDEVALSAGVCEATPITAGSPGTTSQSCETPVALAAAVGGAVQPLTTSAVKGFPPHQLNQHCQSVHWRDVMQENGWDWLLI